MSAAPEFPPEVYIPERARTPRPVRRHRLTVVAPARGRVPLSPAGLVSIDDELESDWGTTSWHQAVGSTHPDSLSESSRGSSAPLRLTRRGVVAITGLALAAAIGVSLFALASAPRATSQPSVPATVTVHSGDTLWSLAERIAPNRDPRAEVDHLAQLNHLGDGALAPGQLLRTR